MARDHAAASRSPRSALSRDEVTKPTPQVSPSAGQGEHE